VPSPDLRPGMHSTSSSTDFARTAVMIFSARYTTFGSISYPLFSSHPHNLPFKTHNLSATSINRLYRECSGRKPPWRVDAVLGLSTCDRVLVGLHKLAPSVRPSALLGRPGVLSGSVCYPVTGNPEPGRATRAISRLVGSIGKPILCG